MSTPNPFKVSTDVISTAVLPGREEQLHGRPAAVTNVHLGTELVYAGRTPAWDNYLPGIITPPLPCQPGTRFKVTKMDTLASETVYDYLLENGDRTITYWISAPRLLQFLTKDVLRIVPRTKLDALRRGPRRHYKY